MKKGNALKPTIKPDFTGNLLLTADLNYNRSNDVIQSFLRENIKQIGKMLLFKLVSTISEIDPLCTENTILDYLPNVQRVLLNQFHDEYYYILSAEKKQLLFSTKWVTENDGTTYKSIMHVS